MYKLSFVDLLELHQQLAKALKELPQRQRRILVMYFGLQIEDGDDGLCYTLLEIGREFGVSRETVRQLKVRALRTLRRRQRWFGLADFLSNGGEDQQKGASNGKCIEVDDLLQVLRAGCP